MALTASEENRIDTIETKLNKIGHLVQGGGSKNQLNRLLILAKEELKKIEDRIDILEPEVSTLLELARKPQ